MNTRPLNLFGVLLLAVLIIGTVVILSSKGISVESIISGYNDLKEGFGQ